MRFVAKGLALIWRLLIFVKNDLKSPRTFDSLFYISIHLTMVNSPRIAVPPTRIAEMGIGSFLILAGSASLALCCTGSLSTTNLTRRNSIQILATAVYGIMVVYLSSAERLSRWEIQNEVDSDVDNTWLVRIIVGIVMIIGRLCHCGCKRSRNRS